MKRSVLQFKFIKTALLWTFLLGVVFISCGKKDSTPPVPINKTSLQDTVNIAQLLNDNTVEGTKPGEYAVGTKAALTTALTAAKGVLANTSATQADVTNAVANLHAAIVAYLGNRINEIAAASLIGYWKMNGNPNDSSGNGNNGTLMAGAALYGAGMPTLTADRFGRAGMAYHFDHGGNIEVPYQTALNPQQLSISLWCKKDTVGRTWAKDAYYMVALDRWNGYKFQFQGTNRPFLTVNTIRTTPVSDTDYVNQDANISYDSLGWRHIVATFKPGEMDFYVNGVLTKSWTGSDAPGTPITVDNTINFIIGQDLPTSKYLTVDGDFQVAWGGFWTGDLDDVMFYNVALEGPQVASIFANQNTL